MSTTLQIQGVKALLRKFDHLADNFKQDAQAALNVFGENVAGDANRLVRSNSSDEGHLLGSISYDKGQLSVSVVAATNYAAYIEFGTRKYAAAYVSTLPQDWASYAATFKGGQKGSFLEFINSIKGWVKRKGIEEKAAYPIALSILRNGIRARPFMYPSVQKNLPILIADLEDILK